jgi:hypothetical protein
LLPSNHFSIFFFEDFNWNKLIIYGYLAKLALKNFLEHLDHTGANQLQTIIFVAL